MKGFTRPQSIVLPENALIPSPNVIAPPPNQFTHETNRELPFYYREPSTADQQPDGTLGAGTQVVILGRYDKNRCAVVDARGMYVHVDGDGLKSLEVKPDR